MGSGGKFVIDDASAIVTVEPAPATTAENGGTPDARHLFPLRSIPLALIRVYVASFTRIALW